MVKSFWKERNICITPTAYKMNLLKELSKEPTFYQIQFLTLSELKKQLFYEYKEDALYEFCQHFHLIPENGAVLLEAMYHITEEIDASLYQKKQWLKEHHLIIEHPTFLESLKKSNVMIYGYSEYEMNPYLDTLKKYTEVNYIDEEQVKYQPTVTEYETLEQEVVGVAENISILLSQGISPNHIFFVTSSNEYQSMISKIFHQFKIPFERNQPHALYEYQMVQELLKKISEKESLQQLPDILAELETKYPNEHPFYHQIFESITAIFNQYYKETRTLNEIKEILIYDLKRTHVKQEHNQNVVTEVDFKTTLFTSDDYVFILGANLGEFPTIYEDTDYLSDQQKTQIGLLTSLEKTVAEEKKIKQKIMYLAHAFISYKKKSPFKEYLKASFLEEFPTEKGEYHYTNHSYNTYLLNASLDEWIHFNHKNKDLMNRYGIEPIYYATYDNQFTGISKHIFQTYIPYVVLSYTTMQKFFECPFKYYVASILKINSPYEDSVSTLVGNLFHSILEQYFKKEKSLDKIIHQELEKVSFTPHQKQKFYQQKYEQEIKQLIERMELQQSHSELKPTFFEKTIEWIENKNITFKIFGKIDKIMTIDDGENSYVIVIDYKTGFWTKDLSKIIYGMNMQLLLYLYLTRKDEFLKKYKLGGAFIAPISLSIPNYVEGKTVEELLWKQSKLDGILLKRTEFIERLDTHYEISSYVKGIRVKKDGDFYASDRLLDATTLERLLTIIGTNIEVIEQEIEKANFKIAPKKFSSETNEKPSSCLYCPYRDICYLKPKDVIRLKEDKELEFLGGDLHDTNETSH